jgi:hypothetical protein
MDWFISRNAFLAWASVFVALSHASPALACAVCGTGQRDPTANTYLLSTALLSFIPLGLIGGVVWYVFKKAREQKP